MRLPAPLATIAALIALVFARLGTWIVLFLQITEGLIRQTLLIAQCLCETFHRLLALRLLPLALLALSDLHVLHHLLEFLQSLLRLGHAALLHQLLDPVHHLLQIVLCHLHRIILCALFALLLLLIAITRRFALQLVDVVLIGAAQLIHQFSDFIIACAIFHRLRQTFLRAAHALERVADITIFDEQRQVPKRLRRLIAVLFAKGIIANLRLYAAQNHPQFQICRFTTEHVIGAMRDCTQHLSRARTICLGPQKPLALLDQGIRHGVKETSPRQRHVVSIGPRALPFGVLNRHRQLHRQVGKRMLGKIAKQRFAKITAIPCNWQRQIKRDALARLWLCFKAVAPRDRCQIKRDFGTARGHLIVIRCREGQTHHAIRTPLRRACHFNTRRVVWRHCNLPAAPIRSRNFQGAACLRDEILFRISRASCPFNPLRHRLCNSERANFTIKT